MVEELLASGISDKSEIKHQFLDAQNISSVGTTTTLPIFKVQDREYLEPVDRWLILQTRNVAGDAFIWGHPGLGIIGTGKFRSSLSYSFILGHAGAAILGSQVLGATTSTWATVRIIQANNSYYESFYDNIFYGSINGTGTWDVSNHRATIGANGTITSGRIYQNVYYVTKALLTATYTGTTFTWYLSNNGTSWTAATLSSELTFSSNGQDLRWKVAGGANGGTITNVSITFTVT